MHIFLLGLVLAALGAGSPVARRNHSYNSGAFSLYAQSSNASLNGRWVAENTSTNNGATEIILAPMNSTIMRIGGFLLDQSQPPSIGMTYFLVNEPERSGGSEYDGWVVNAANASGLTAPQVVPAGSTRGWSLVNVTRGGQVQQELSFSAGGKNASFLVCNEDLGKGAVQQLLFSFNSTVSKCCQNIQLIASF